MRILHLKKLFILAVIIILSSSNAFAIEDSLLIKEQSIQNQINQLGTKILNANKIDKRIIFVYDKSEKKSLLKTADTVTKRQIVMYENDFKYISNEDEAAAFITREILTAVKSYRGPWNGGLSAVQIKAAPKKYEIISDKTAVDYMVQAGYDPIGLITYINKSCPQKRFDRFSNRNLTSKRLAHIYEYIYTKYPYYLANNKYFQTDAYQNFLLTSIYNRRLLEQKINSHSTEELDYE